MKRTCWLLLLFTLGTICFAQKNSAIWPNYVENHKSGIFNYTPSLDVFRPVQMADETTQDPQTQSIFENSPLWVKDLRRGEIVFFGTLPLTLFFTRTFVDLYRMGTHGWDQRYAPWPFQSAGAVSMNTGEIIMTFGIALGASLTISIADHFIFRAKRKAKAALGD